jgi:hypothetical protein
MLQEISIAAVIGPRRCVVARSVMLDRSGQSDPWKFVKIEIKTETMFGAARKQSGTFPRDMRLRESSSHAVSRSGLGDLVDGTRPIFCARVQLDSTMQVDDEFARRVCRQFCTRALKLLTWVKRRDGTIRLRKGMILKRVLGYFSHPVLSGHRTSHQSVGLTPLL